MSILAPYYLTTAKMTRAGLICMLILLVLVSGCAQEKRPAGILDKERYAEYLVNIYVAEAKLNTFVISEDSGMKLFQPYEKALQQKMGTPDTVIQNTYLWYQAHPEEWAEVYTAIIDSLNLREQKAKSLPIQPR